MYARSLNVRADAAGRVGVLGGVRDVGGAVLVCAGDLVCFVSLPMLCEGYGEPCGLGCSWTWLLVAKVGLYVVCPSRSRSAHPAPCPQLGV